MLNVSATDYRFPAYTPAEVAVDRVIHFVGVPAAFASACWLIVTADPARGDRLLVTLVLYGTALVGTLAASAAYNLTPAGPNKEFLRRIDHSMIFVMIGATYTPLALNAMLPIDGLILCIEVWTLAAVGIVISVCYPRRYDGALLGLYLCMGWLVLGVIRTLIERLPQTALLLLLTGGVVLTLGAFIHTRDRLQYHNAIWHALVLVGTGLHLAAIHVAFAPVDAVFL